MTISSTTRRAGPYSGTGAQTAFPFAFKVFTAADLLVVQADTFGAENQLTLNSHYSVSLNADQDANPGGVVTLGADLPAGFLLTIGSSVPLTQGTSIPNMGGFYPKVIEHALDKLTIAAQQTAEWAARSLKFAFSDAGDGGTLPTTAVRAGKFLAFDSAGNPTAASGTGTDSGLRTDLASRLSGSALVNFTQAGAAMAQRTAQDKLREWVSILDAGGSPDGQTPNTTPLARLYDSGSRLIRFPRGGANNYLIDNTISSVVTNDMLWDVDPGVTITVPDVGYLSPTLKVTRPTRIAISGLNREYTLTPNRGYVEAFRPSLLPQSDADYSVAIPVYPSAGGFAYKKAAWPGGDDFTTYSPTSYANDNVVISGPVDGNFYHALYTPKIGDELTAQLYNAIDNQVLRAMVRTSTGYVGLNLDALTDSNPKYFEKYRGRAAVEVPINYPGVNTHVSYAAYYSLITIRINSKNSFSILFNGMEVLPARTVEGEIIEAGFGIYGIGATAKVTIQDPVVVRDGVRGGIAPIRIAAFGDSRTAAGMPDVWINWLRAYLDGYKGMRVHQLINYGVSGSAIAQQAALCTPQNIANVDIVIIDIGTNDIQALTSDTVYYNTLKGMVQTCQASGKKVILGIPDMFYGQGQAGAGVGQLTQRYELGKGIRAKCLRLAADMGVKVVNKMEALGPITAQYVNASIANSYVSLGLDPVLYDSIHPTAFGHQLIARCYAAAIIGLLTTRPDGTAEATGLPASGLRNGWTLGGGSEAPTWERSEDGEVRLQGLFMAGTVVNGTVIYVLPEEARPRKTQRLMGMNDANVPMILNIDTNGEISIPNVTGLTSYVGIDDIRFPTRLS